MAGLLVVDDIPIIRSTVARIVTKQKPDLQPVVQASTGEEAINLTRIHQPDIILMDIKMPRLDGLEAVSAIRSEYPTAKIIMLTAFEEFTYAQQALKLGAVDYLLKPIRPTKLIEALSRVESQISEERRRRQEMELVKAQLQQTLPLVEANLLESVIRETSVQDIIEIETMLAALGKTITMPVIVAFVFNPVKPPPSRPLRISEELYQKQQLTATLQRALPAPDRTLISCRWLAREVILLISTEPAHTKPGYLPDLVETLRRIIETEIGGPVVAGVGLPYPQLNSMGRSYSEACLACYTVPASGGVAHIAELQAVTLQALPGHAGWQQGRQLLASVRQNQYQAGLKVLRKLCAHIEPDSLSGRAQNSVVPHRIRLLILIAWTALEGGASPAGVLKLVQQQIAWPTAAGAKQWLLHGYTELMSFVESTSHQKEPVQSAVEYIHRNLHRADITLADVAEVVSLSPSHLAHLLKTQLGMSYIKYLTLARIEQAKKLLCTTDFNINTIADMVGYRNLTNFYRLFQRETSLTPAAYRRAAPSL